MNVIMSAESVDKALVKEFVIKKEATDSALKCSKRVSTYFQLVLIEAIRESFIMFKAVEVSIF